MTSLYLVLEREQDRAGQWETCLQLGNRHRPLFGPPDLLVAVVVAGSADPSADPSAGRRLFHSVHLDHLYLYLGHLIHFSLLEELVQCYPQPEEPMHQPSEIKGG